MGKTCLTCEENDETKFRYGRKTCLKCNRKQSNDYYYAHKTDEFKEKKANKKKKDRRDNPVRYLFWNAKFRAKKEGTKFDIREEDIELLEFCPVLGIKMFIGEGKFGPNSPTLDRVDNELGYIKGNIQVISWRANSLKKDASVLELKCLLKYMTDFAEKKKNIDSSSESSYDCQMKSSSLDLFRWKFETAAKQSFLKKGKNGEQTLDVGPDVWNSLENLEKTGRKFHDSFFFNWVDIKNMHSREELLKFDLVLLVFLLCDGKAREVREWKENLKKDRNYLYNLPYKAANWY